jgi:dipeptidyl aminopeptidase/acylaminoacyl peptidase
MARRSVPAVVIGAGVAVVVLLRLGIGDGGETRDPRHPVDPPFIIFRMLGADATHGRVGLLSLKPQGSRHASRLTCVRLHYAGGHGLCVTQELHDRQSVHAAYVFDERLEPGARIALDGVTTRVRVAPNGRVGAISTYAEEESPAGERLATWTRIIELPSGRQIADLREFRIDSDRLPPVHHPIDISSVAFEPDGDRFFATVAAADEHLLAAGSLTERRLTLLHAGVANEALSPDGRRLAVKRLRSDRGFWQIAVLDLGSWKEHDLLQGARSVDDQVEWFDSEHVMYHEVDGDTTALYALPIDGVNGPRVIVKNAYSGAVQR